MPRTVRNVTENEREKSLYCLMHFFTFRSRNIQFDNYSVPLDANLCTFTQNIRLILCKSINLRIGIQTQLIKSPENAVVNINEIETPTNIKR